jgi:hypothetical protein
VLMCQTQGSTIEKSQILASSFFLSFKDFFHNIFLQVVGCRVHLRYSFVMELISRSSYELTVFTKPEIVGCTAAVRVQINSSEYEERVFFFRLKTIFIST